MSPLRKVVRRIQYGPPRRTMEPRSVVPPLLGGIAWTVLAVGFALAAVAPIVIGVMPRGDVAVALGMAAGIAIAVGALARVMAGAARTGPLVLAPFDVEA